MRPSARRIVRHLGDGRWSDEEQACWRDDRGRRLRGRARPKPLPRQLRLEALAGAAPDRVTRVVLAGAHLDHDPGSNHPRNLAALCQRCHLAHDRPEHRRRGRARLFRRRALGDLFLGSYR